MFKQVETLIENIIKPFKKNIYLKFIYNYNSCLQNDRVLIHYEDQILNAVEKIIDIEYDFCKLYKVWYDEWFLNVLHIHHWDVDFFFNIEVYLSWARRFITT
jgi:hypothetical protein